jgi:hemoglobin/transferrin/lactoferrin receptor protein
LTLRRRVPVWLVVACLGGAPAAALEVRLVHADGSAVAHATVSILGHTGSARTDAGGRFRWTPDPVPPFEVLVVLPGGRYMKPVLVDRLPADGALTIELSALLEESVTVTAGSAPGIESAPASGTALLSSREIELRQPANLTQLLENVAGVSTVSEGQAAVPAVRGLARGRTLILIDGARVSAERRVGPSATSLDPFVLEAVEVSRGPGSVAYGSDAFGGVIHARTRRPEHGGPLRGRLEAGLGAGVPARRVAAELSKGVRGGGVLVQGHYRDFDDYRSPRGDVFNSGARDRGVLARGERIFGRGLLALGWQSDFGRDIERPRDNSRTVRFYYPREDSHRLTASYEHASVSGFSRLGMNAFLGSYALVTDQDQAAADGRARTIERADISARDFQVRAFAERPLGGAKLEAGLDLNGRFGLEALDVGITEAAAGGRTESVNVSVEDARRRDAGAYLTAERALGSLLTLAAGLRADHVRTRNRGGFFGDHSTQNGALSGFAAVTVAPARGFNASLQAARGFRDPVLSDRYFRGPSGRGFITGSPELDPETSFQLDLALRYTAERFRLAAYAYHYRIRDLVERYQTDPDFFFFRNRGRARLRGVELEGQAQLGGGLSLELAAHLARGRALDDRAPLDDVAPATVTARVRKELGTRAFVQVRGAAYARDDRPGPTEREIPGYGLLDAAAGVRLHPRVEVRLLGRNLLDKDYLVSTDPRTVAAPGVSGLATVVVHF